MSSDTLHMGTLIPWCVVGESVGILGLGRRSISVYGFPAPVESAIVPFLINWPAIVFYFVICLLGDSSQVASWPSADRHKDTSTSCDKATRPRRLASVVRLIVHFFTYQRLRLWKVRQSSELVSKALRSATSCRFPNLQGISTSSASLVQCPGCGRATDGTPCRRRAHRWYGYHTVPLILTVNAERVGGPIIMSFLLCRMRGVRGHDSDRGTDYVNGFSSISQNYWDRCWSSRSAHQGSFTLLRTASLVLLVGSRVIFEFSRARGSLLLGCLQFGNARSCLHCSRTLAVTQLKSSYSQPDLFVIPFRPCHPGSIRQSKMGSERMMKLPVVSRSGKPWRRLLLDSVK